MSHSEYKVETNTIAEEQVDGPKSLSDRAAILRRFFSIYDPNPPPPPTSLHDAVLIPEASAGFFGQLWFTWLTPLLSLGFARPLEASDLYRLPDEHSSARVANAILASFERRRKEAALYNTRLENGQVGPGIQSLWWSIRDVRVEREKLWRDKDGKRKASLILAMNDSVKWRFWSAGILKVIGDTAQVTSALVVKAIITFATESYAGHITGTPIPPIGTGIGLCFVLLALQLIASWCTQHFFYRSMACGVLLRGGLITAIYSRALSLSPRARVQMTNGRLVNHISTDVSRIDFCSGYFHMSWTALIQVIICLILLLINLGPSALAGFALLIIATPINTMVMKRLFSIRIKSMSWTDKRSKLLQEMLSGIRVIKLFSWELPFLKRVAEYRMLETANIRSLLIFRAGSTAFAVSIPTLAAVIAFITYSLTGHSLTAANIFSSLALFQLIRPPLMLLPMSLSSIVDAVTACKRLYEVFEAETSDETLVFNDDLDVAVRIDGADFTWDSPPPRPEDPKASRGMHNRTTGNLKSKLTTPPTPQPVDDANIFQLRGSNMEIPRGKLVAIVGAIGAGKTSLLQGMIGEMRRTAGTVEFGGSVAYCAQTAWIQNATIRENICFGRPFEEERYWKAVHDSSLEPDLQMLPHYDLTEVGEKGISLSGGQKQRINICRAIYCNSDIMIFDDPLSALDAHVGKAVFSNVLKSGTAGKTRILVTHALHFLPEVDYIYTMVDGKIAERGTFDALIARDGAFCKFIEEFGSQQDNSEKNAGEKNDMVRDDKKEQHVGIKGKAMMQEEERITGAISWKVYREYLSAGHGVVLVPIVFLSLALLQGSSVLSSYWLVYWEEMKWDYPRGFYMGIYAALGVSQALTMFFTGAAFAILTYYASQELQERAITRVLHAPMSFFETTPLGRIMNRFAKDIDTVDNLVGDSLRMLSITTSSVIGAIIIISVVLPWFLLVLFFILICYFYAAFFYRASARELKTARFKKENVELVDIENRAYWLTITNQRWLGIRLDLLGATLTFAVAILTVGTRFSISPGQTGLVLSYILMVQQSFGMMVRQVAEAENNMNAVERIIHYANEVEQEAPHQVKDSAAPPSWPFEGRIVMKYVFMKYRPELPPVLKGLSMDIAPGEKIGIAGRTGAGKSSIMTALYRLVELSSGSIQIDGVDISKVGLEQLRKGLAIIPQDAVISGTLRSNLDPFSLYDDAHLWDALKRAHLVDTDEDEPPSPQTSSQGDAQVVGGRFDLDTPIDGEGSNLSVGQRSLVSLARALVHETKILVLDEATASVDYETDAKIQYTIATEFKGRTILCIAHRLRTIISYDRICVLDAGTIAEFDTPANLFSTPGGIFRGMCDRSSISREDILSAAK
ncbi:P-loop containing nucleoside triphosphate hydrolase protein [Imleria badia]|nr:P-loop containing nucleoside triphosphate hydrolase protein [Imleria badia]